MGPLLPLAAWLGAAALGAVAVETDARLAARGREVRLEGGSSGSTRELEVSPRLALLGHGEVELTLAYAPRLTFPLEPSRGARELASGAELRARGEILHRAELALRRAVTPNLALALRAEGASGRIDLRRSEVYVDEALPSGDRLAWRSAGAAIEATATPARRITVSTGLRVFETGGADDRAREFVPLQRGARLDAAVRYSATRHDVLSLLLDGSYSRFLWEAERLQAAIVRLGGGWARSLGPTLTARASSGAAWSSSSAGLVPAVREITPFAEAGLSHAPLRPSVLSEVSFRITPYLNPFAGGIDQRLEATATTRWRASGRWELSARAAAAATRGDTSAGAFWTGQRRAELTSLDLRASWAFARRGTLSLGPWVRDQRSHDRTLPTFVEWGAAFELGVGTRWQD